MVEMLLSLSVEEFIDCVLLPLLVSLGVEELGVDLEKDVLVLVSVWLAVNHGCWLICSSFVD